MKLYRIYYKTHGKWSAVWQRIWAHSVKEAEAQAAAKYGTLGKSYHAEECR